MNNNLVSLITDEALRLGFAKVGFAEAHPQQDGHKALQNWLTQGYHGTMAYMEEHPRHTTEHVLPHACTVVAVAWPYPKHIQHSPVARYAHTEDYHSVIKQKLSQLAEHIRPHIPHTAHIRACVDTAPILERAWAQQAGVAFAGKSTMGIVPGTGTYVLLGELLIDIPLPPSQPLTPKCGSCTACLHACPTHAFVKPYVLDARRCIAYLTIEHKGSVQRNLRSLIGQRVFGCDVCQEVCPYNHSPKPSKATQPVLPHIHTPDLVQWLSLTSSSYKRLVKNTALRRASAPQLARNAAIALGNTRNPSYFQALSHAALNHSHPLVREHATWGLSQIHTPDTRTTLVDIAQHDQDPTVRAEALMCLEECPR